MSQARRIAHLDMDAFFASVELLSYPELHGQAVVVGGRAAAKISADGKRNFPILGDYVGRGVATTSTYEARALGVFSGMGLMKSAKLAPDAVLLPANFDAYRHYSRLFKQAVAGFTSNIEDRGIDEIYIDLSELPETSDTLAMQIKQAVFAATGLTCSIGISPNKLLAKICSDLNKPDGITILHAHEIPARIWPLAVKKINGIGPKSAERLARMNVHTIGELAAAPPETLIRYFGRSTGVWLHEAAHGIDERPLNIESEPKSISRESTFEHDLHAIHDKAALTDILSALCLRVAEDLKQKGYGCRTVGIKLRYADFQSVTRDISLPCSINDAQSIRQAARKCLKRVPLEQKIRLLGVRTSRLIALNEANFQPPETELNRQLELRF